VRRNFLYDEGEQPFDFLNIPYTARVTPVRDFLFGFTILIVDVVSVVADTSLGADSS